MFWACSVNGSKTFDIKSAAKAGELLHISQAVLHPSSGEGTVTIFVTMGKDKFPLAHYQRSTA